jgi:hypothetical protein
MRSHLLIVLCMALAGMSAAIAEEDPHQDWRPDKVVCSNCHACDSPTAEEPCLIACPRHSDHFYGHHEAGEGPDVVIIDQLTDLYSPVVFAHRLHADMANMSGGCENCHHYSEQSGTIPPCRSCHPADLQEVDMSMPALKGAYHRQCINCHLDWAHENACGFCHEEGTVADTTGILGVPHPLIEATDIYNYQTTYEDGPVVSFHHGDHIDQFGLQCVDCHRGDSCKSCHDTGVHEARKIDHTVTCGACHAERDCAFCHTDAPRDCFHHATRVGWDLEPYHSDVECRTCHGEPQQFRTPAGACAGCHIHWETGTFDHRKVGLALDEMHGELDCVDCHEDRAFHRPPSCESCHDEPMYPDQVPGEKVVLR